MFLACDHHSVCVKIAFRGDFFKSFKSFKSFKGSKGFRVSCGYAACFIASKH